MRSVRNARFLRTFEQLPKPVQEIARTAYGQFEKDPFSPKLDFHEIKGTKTSNVYAVNAGQYHRTSYRALGVWDKQTDTIVWFWIGSHEAYNNIIRRL